MLDKEKDDFWDIEKLVPKKKPVMHQFSSAPAVKEHRIDGVADKDTENRRLSFTGMSARERTEDTVYTPEGGGLIKRVTIKRYVDKYDFYGNFRKAALIYYDYKTPKCDFAPFYSYMPQYSQFNMAQKNYYFYWRSELRRGKYIKSDYSYIYLYVYEILNLPDMVPPEEGIKLLCRLWREYRGDLPRIDAYFSVWVQDYCLVYNLPCPMGEVREFIFDVISASEFKEFYLSDIDGAGTDGVDAMIAYLSDYDWRRGKYAAGENEEIYKRHMYGSMCLLFDRLEVGKREATAEVSTVKRDAFPHSLCTHAVKCKLEIEYVALAREEGLRKIITAGVRYTENKLRALFGIKSRLGIKDFGDEYKRLIDSYFASIFEYERRMKEREVAPEYEKLYDAESTGLSFVGADEIERVSWSTTARLVVEDEESRIENSAESTPEPPCEPDVCETDVNSSQSETYGLSNRDIALIRAAYDGHGELIDDGAMERINEAFSDGFGDVILEHDGEKYIIIEDYKEEIGEWLLK